MNYAGSNIYQTIIGSHTRTAVSGAELGINGQAWDFRTGSSTVSSATIYDDLNAGTVTNGVWTHVVATFDGSVKRLYIDGVLAGTETTNVFASTSLWRIGADNTFQASAGNHLTGWIDEPAIYWQPLTQAQVLNHYNMGLYGMAQPPSITIQQNGANISLSWSGSWVLQHSYDLGCPSCWQDVNNATSPYTATQAPQGHEFFRLRNP
ncbi:LamG domain-containing protein [Pedosphaera parvula]|uniref:LamG domain protein jellyroll fold domain protein n=1 Tax=Pedosphaera parvula (strain Ellin514) TaxID=320771 RepID=B9XP35_PEDPL|nr:LamG domain-containing protein [Pedosphaera parvula]EEF58391.1 hypothetical protein Cflav_PD6134 [Pedosphaera parvula Ellin514]